ncbi:MAG TPA: hypothetical protein VK689_12385 [Armatimonadota bacterium]|nr:hypothetical protein [Armatimonadota bacterium]
MMHRPEPDEVREPPQTQASGLLCAPPRWPPAPPGTGEAPPPGGDSFGGRGFIPLLNLEEALNDFAVIRTTLETMDVFPDDEELRAEMMEIIREAQRRLVTRLETLSRRIRVTRFRSSDLAEFKSTMVRMASHGSARRQLDSLMKVDVFEALSETEGGTRDPLYRYEFCSDHPLSALASLQPPEFAQWVIDDLLIAVVDEGNYAAKRVFDERVFSKFVAVLYAVYATTDPLFYGTAEGEGGAEHRQRPSAQAIVEALQELRLPPDRKD